MTRCLLPELLEAIRQELAYLIRSEWLSQNRRALRTPADRA